MQAMKQASQIQFRRIQTYVITTEKQSSVNMNDSLTSVFLYLAQI